MSGLPGWAGVRRAGSEGRPAGGRVRLGLETFLADGGFGRFKGPLGLLANQASVGPDYRHALAVLDQARPGQVKAVFSPQHGWAGEKQDNMRESAHGSLKDGRPIFSLYGRERRPTPEMLQNLSALIVDLPDVGTRVYTFAQTMSLCLEACAEAGVEVVVLDRPNPVGGLALEGNLLDDDCRSFVGLHPTPLRHGLTLGELAVFFAARLPRPPALTVAPLQGWRREMFFADTGLPWVMPSPNLPTAETAWLYPGQVLWEGTNLSEGRGTTKPFHLTGAPFVDGEKLAADLRAFKLPGLAVRAVQFEPCFGKWAGQVCGGVELHPLDRSFEPLWTSLSMLEAILKRWPEDFRLKEPPYEYEWDRRPIDLILGRRSVFDQLAAGVPARTLRDSFVAELAAFERARRETLLYA
ncbi:MAG: DUF1343 domain-containing protein [Deltaproteobacteria bacterium]|jgi:uncharacterized protein YbbC (DUF1343 family)|nr:DUF1343 domain-containing protein [Deltaproteobacteria bacterium]